MTRRPTASPFDHALRVFHILAFAAVIAGLFLLCHRLGWNGSTWDERADYRISRDFVRQGSVLENKADPSQSRLPHMIGAISLATFGETTRAFKIPFVLAGVVCGLLLFAFVRARDGSLTALYAFALFLTNPWALASSRTAATAGDILVVLTTFVFLWLAIRMYEKADARGPGIGATAGLALATGVAIGAKLTSAVLLPAGLLLLLVVYGRRSPLHVVLYAVVAVVVTIALHPLLVTHTESLFGAAFGAFAKTPALFEHLGESPAVDLGRSFLGDPPIELEPTPKFHYVLALLVSKLTLPLLLFVVAGIGFGFVDAWRERRLDARFWGPLSFVVAPCVVLVWKYKQNGNYYLPLLLPAMTLAAIALARGLHASRAWCRASVAAAWLAIVGYQVHLDVGLAPDYLQAGRRLGPTMQGKMAGPAINHCQGTPILIDTLNRLRASGESFEVVGVLETCLPVMQLDVAHGPIAPDGYRFVRYNARLPPRGPHVFVVHKVIRIDEYGMPVFADRLRWLQRATLGCTYLNANRPMDRFEIYKCPDRG